MVKGEAGAPEAIGTGGDFLPRLLHLGQDLLHRGGCEALGGWTEGGRGLPHASRSSTSSWGCQRGHLFFPGLLFPSLSSGFSSSGGLRSRPGCKGKGTLAAAVGLGSCKHVHLPGRRQLSQGTPGGPGPNRHQQAGLGRQGWLGRQGPRFGLDGGFGPRVTY